MKGLPVLAIGSTLRHIYPDHHWTAGLADDEDAIYIICRRRKVNLGDLVPYVSKRIEMRVLHLLQTDEQLVGYIEAIANDIITTLEVGPD